MSFLIDIFILFKLLAYAVWSSLMTFIRFAFIPKSFMMKSIENQVVLITGAGISAFISVLSININLNNVIN
jgi:hypothetical protein